MFKYRSGVIVSRYSGLTNHLKVNELEVSKQKATELLRSHDGNAVKAMTAFVMTAP